MSDVLYEVVLPRLEGIRKQAGYYMARCPAHPDRQPSLSVSVGKEHPVVFHCHAGCERDAILDALGLTWAELCKPREERPRGGEWTPRGDAIAVYDYFDENGELLFQVLRTADKQFPCRIPDRSKKSGWAWRLGDTRRVPYRLPQILAAVRAGTTVYIAEGERDCNTLERHGLEATCNPGGAGKWRQEYAEHLSGADVVVIADRDDPGLDHARHVARTLAGVAAHVRIVQAAAGKDATDHFNAGHGAGDFVALDADQAPPRADEPPPADEEPPRDPFEDTWVGDAECSAEEILSGVYPTPEDGQARFIEPPEPLGGIEAEPKPLDVDQALPPRLAEFVRAVAEHLEVPIEAVASMAIAALSVAAVGRHMVDGGGGWLQPLILWMAAGLPPGERKSDLIRITAGPLRLAERGLAELHQAKMDEAAAERELLDPELKRIKEDLRKGNGDKQTLESDLADVQDKLKALPPKDASPPRLLVEDTTPEALSQRLKENDEALGIMTAEGGVFNIIKGRYSDGNASFEIYLKAYDEEYIPFDRVERGTVILHNPALAMGLCVQPDVIMDVAKIPGIRERGFLGRWFYVLPKSMLGYRKNRRTRMPQDQLEWWSQTLQGILNYTPHGPKRPYLTLDADADKLLQHLLDNIEPNLEETVGRFNYMRDWASKLCGKVLRLAGLFHLAQGYGEGRPISAATMTYAVAFGLWTINHAERVYKAWLRRDIEPGVEPILAWIRKRKPDTFAAGDLKTSLRNASWYSSEARDAALVKLYRDRWITSVIQYDGRGRRRKTAVFMPHPDLIKGQR
ncbi:DUF3987 domain-containing protein [Allonocardiopsis opalescens]|uniref:Uncharacterized protein DUF3987 n=1 Tax=Allonocardiopsis opalescens TaxID=1144618 RepID=A0A2T0PPV7_9ACTN|nr:DUF3987 domain-containing protein [Allonocardiopsis opalescens]PRX90848.1 uncharacterized protein DUF3987 [Allonocardiopsis opalescens]